ACLVLECDEKQPVCTGRSGEWLDGEPDALERPTASHRGGGDDDLIIADRPMHRTAKPGVQPLPCEREEVLCGGTLWLDEIARGRSREVEDVTPAGDPHARRSEPLEDSLLREGGDATQRRAGGGRKRDAGGGCEQGSHGELHLVPTRRPDTTEHAPFLHDRLEQIILVAYALRGPEKQVATVCEREMQQPEQLPLRRGFQVHEYVAAGDEVDLGEG